MISSLNRKSYGETISMAAFKESGTIEYSADVLLGLQFQNQENIKDLTQALSSKTRDVELVVLKNRKGVAGKHIKFKYNARFNYFEEKYEKK